MAYRDYYQILGVSRTASVNEIRTAFHQLALAYHPDRNPGDKQAEEKFKEINEAYQVLSDPEARTRYDQLDGYFNNQRSSPEDFDRGQMYTKPANQQPVNSEDLFDRTGDSGFWGFFIAFLIRLDVRTFTIIILILSFLLFFVVQGSSISRNSVGISDSQPTLAGNEGDIPDRQPILFPTKIYPTMAYPTVAPGVLTHLICASYFQEASSPDYVQGSWSDDAVATASKQSCYQLMDQEILHKPSCAQPGDGNSIIIVLLAQKRHTYNLPRDLNLSTEFVAKKECLP